MTFLILVLYLRLSSTQKTPHYSVEFNTLFPSCASNYHQTIHLNVSKATDWWVTKCLSLRNTCFSTISERDKPGYSSNNGRLFKFFGGIFCCNNWQALTFETTYWDHRKYAIQILWQFLNYGSLIWGHDCNRLIKLQIRIARTINRNTTPTQIRYQGTLYSEFSGYCLSKCAALKIYYKYLNDVLPDYLTIFEIQTQSSIHDHLTPIRLTEKCLRNYLELSTHCHRFCFKDYAIKGQYSIHTMIFVCNKISLT